MRIRRFTELLEFEDMTLARLRVGDRFLTGTRIIAQKEEKGVGDMITYYVVTHASPDGKDISYKPIYEKLEE